MTSSPIFQSTLPIRGATISDKYGSPVLIFQSTLPIRGATSRFAPSRYVPSISIHAPHTGSDFTRTRHRPWSMVFQSTLPIRGATCQPRSPGGRGHNFNPRSPYGERRYQWPADTPLSQFQSTLPIRGATRPPRRAARRGKISIHAPHTGSDTPAHRSAARPADFNPRSPYGERPSPSCPRRAAPSFQSTLPIRGATDGGPPVRASFVFQSTLPIRGATSFPACCVTGNQFQSTLPIRGATR